MAETCDEPGCPNEPVFTFSILRRTEPGATPYYRSEHQDLCEVHARFIPTHTEDSLRVEAYSPLSHHRLLHIVKRLPEDYAPFGLVDGEANPNGMGYSDCSCGCRFSAVVEGSRGADWGVCCNPASHRAGLLTFEHQGCYHFEPTPEDLTDG